VHHGADSATAGPIRSLPALGRAEARPAPRHVRGLDEEIAAPAAGADVVGPRLPRQVPVHGTIPHGGRYRNAEPPLWAHHPISGKPGQQSADVTRRRERSEPGHEVALTPARSDRHSLAWGGGRRREAKSMIAWL